MPVVESVVSRNGDKCHLHVALIDMKGACIMVDVTSKCLGLLVVGLQTETVTIGVKIELHILVLTS